jgi:tetratricopeptide (TPR) repeat protein
MAGCSMSGQRRRRGRRAPARTPFLEALGEGARLLQAGRAREALPFLQRAIELEPTDTDAAINLGGAHIMLNQHRKAVPILEQACAAQPGNSKIWINLGAAYLGNPVLATADQQTRAIAAFEKALELDPVAPSVNYNLGLIYRDQGDLAAAIAQFHRAVAVNPLDRDARRLLEKMQEMAGDPSPQKPSPNGGDDGR